MNDLFEEVIQELSSDNDFYEYTQKRLWTVSYCDNVVRYKDKIVCGIVIYQGLVRFVFKDFLIYEVETFHGTALRKRTWKYHVYGTWGSYNNLPRYVFDRLEKEQQTFYFKNLDVFGPVDMA